MKGFFYPKLALDAIRKNKRFYLPYILTCVGTVMMFYIIHYLAAMPSLEKMSGGRTMVQVLGFGFWVMALFSVIFLFYTNSFLMRRRQKEFGLYNILGMGKGSLGVLLLWENVILSVLSVVVGLASGMLLSKLAELCLINIMDGEIDYKLRIDPDALIDTLAVFAVIFGLIFIKDLINIGRMSAISLIKSENVGEKPPKANYLFGALGVVILGAAYYIAVSIDNPLIALAWFFIAVILVIIATYVLFISGSVALCRILQKNKRYYYKKNHFVSVSSMAYRMKRNGASLASICILSTMVLVMMMGAGSLYFGKESIINKRYSHDISVSVDFLSVGEEDRYTEAKEAFMVELIEGVAAEHDAEPKSTEHYVSSMTYGMLSDGKLTLGYDWVNSADMQTIDEAVNVYLVSLDSYNRCMDAEETLDDDEIMLHCVRTDYKSSAVTLSDGTVWTVKKQLDSIMGSGEAASMVTPSLFIVVPDIYKAVDTFNSLLGELPEDDLCRFTLKYSFDTALSDDEQTELGQAVSSKIREAELSGEAGLYSSSVDSKADDRGYFFGLYGGIFFLGIFLSVVFVAATVLIIYYKQISEGYEDQGRFEIMQKVGMTKQDIKKSVNSQMLTVFFLPLVLAGVHLAFALPFVTKILMLFMFEDTMLNIIVTAACFVIFGIFYVVVYKITSGSYYAIVSGKENKR